MGKACSLHPGLSFNHEYHPILQPNGSLDSLERVIVKAMYVMGGSASAKQNAEGASTRSKASRLSAAPGYVGIEDSSGQRDHRTRGLAVIVRLGCYEVVEVVLVLSMTQALGCCFSSSFL